ncbi:MAG TPA: imidazole glycerol phosphate synthase subunit HisH [Pseudomonadales bacterium]|nr:imidazole glycerol phosphate synthase subunit HisH [Pseudomonadales bacterium]
MTATVAVIDYGMGNLHSVASALQHADPSVRVNVSADPAVIRAADRVVFPGVGAIRDCMAEIHRLGVGDMLREAMASKPVLGICVGMQAMLEHSQENGGVDCLGLFPGEVKFFGNPLQDAAGQRLKVPHMGWNNVQQDRAHPLWQGIPDGERFYFVHSYYADCAGEAHAFGRCDYGVTFTAAIGRDNVFAVQFHPEKSHTAGLRLLHNFLQWDGQI